MTADPARVPVRKLNGGALMPAIGLGTFGSDCYSAAEVATAVAGALEVGYRHFGGKTSQGLRWGRPSSVTRHSRSDSLKGSHAC